MDVVVASAPKINYSGKEDILGKERLFMGLIQDL